MSRLTRWLAPTTDRPRPLRPALRRLRPRAGPHRGRVLPQDHREVRGQRGRDLPRPAPSRSRRSGRSWSSTTSTSCGTTTSSPSTSRRSRTSTSCSGTRPSGVEGQGVDRRRRREEAARHDRRDRRRLEGDRRRGEDPRRRPARLIRPRPVTRIPRPRRPAGPRRTEPSGAPARPVAGRRREASMAPAIAAGDWLLVDPTTVRWPRRGTVVVFREPDGGALAVKRVAAGPATGSPFARRLSRARRRRGLAAGRRHGRRDRRGAASGRRSTRAATARCRVELLVGRAGSATRRCAGSAGSPGRRRTGPTASTPAR